MENKKATVYLEQLERQFEALLRSNGAPTLWAEHVQVLINAIRTAIDALRGPTREQVSASCRGEWVKKHKHRGGFRRVTGVDDMGEEHTITIDERCEYDDLYCGLCGMQSADNFLDFCPSCGAPMTDKAVDIVMQRWEALYDKDV